MWSEISGKVQLVEKQKITGRSGPTPNLISWHPGEYALPMKHIKTGRRTGGALALLAGIPWTYYSARFLLEEVGRAGIDSGQFFLLLLAMGGVAVLLCGLSQFIYREETIIYPDMVSWRRHGLGGFRAWKEPLAIYSGVLKEHRYWDNTDKPGPSYMIYSVTLLHKEPSKRALLYEANNQSMYPPPEWEEKWKHYSETFHLPLLEETDEGIVSSSAEDLTLPLLQRVANGKVEVPRMDPSRSKLGAGISASRENDLWVVTLVPVFPFLKGVGGVVLMVALLGVSFSFGLVRPDLALYLVLPVLLVIVFFGISISRRLKHPEQVAVDKTAVWYRSWDNRRGWNNKSIAINNILNISVKHDPADFRMGDQIIIEGRSDTLRFGGWLSSKTRRKIKALILSLVCWGGD